VARQPVYSSDDYPPRHDVHHFVRPWSLQSAQLAPRDIAAADNAAPIYSSVAFLFVYAGGSNLSKTASTANWLLRGCDDVFAPPPGRPENKLGIHYLDFQFLQAPQFGHWDLYPEYVLRNYEETSHAQDR